ncbi:MAG: hydantoinase/oxoprolinase family protein, partial [Alphaproteobacteria bacterium]|nr:hydantoinase/oxoprolinase family protein [Alphaproteobacteria bacterium]
GVRSVAVCYLHAYKNSAHERETAADLAEAAPDLAVSCSSDIAPEIREYERTSTTVINAYLQPVLEHYLRRLAERFAALGVTGAFHLMLSSGLLTTADQARRFPTRLIESGPAGGVMLAARFARLTGRSNLIAVDMGGTTAKAALIHDGEVPVAREFEVARLDRFKRGSGFPVRTPCVEIEEIGTGGGSIAWIDRLGQLQVGPRSAGSAPGPACYGSGGAEPTVTDADLVLGYLDPDYFLGGEMTLDRAAAARAIESRIAQPLGLTLEQAAWGIHRVANEEMANAFRIHAMEQGRDPARYALLCFGGAGPVHAHGVARLLRSPAIISPALAGVASSLGFLVAPVASESARSYVARLDRLDWSHLNALLGELEAAGRRFVADAGIDPSAVTVTRSADMQYVGQMHDIAVPVPAGVLGPADAARLRDAFQARYGELFQRTVALPVEALTWRVTVSAAAPEIDLARHIAGAGGVARKGERPAYFEEARGTVATAVYDRYRLRPGDRIDGPAIIEERESTLVVGPGSRVTMDAYGSLIVDPPAADAKEAA